MQLLPTRWSFWRTLISASPSEQLPPPPPPKPDSDPDPVVTTTTVTPTRPVVMPHAIFGVVAGDESQVAPALTRAAGALLVAEPGRSLGEREVTEVLDRTDAILAKVEKEPKKRESTLSKPFPPPVAAPGATIAIGEWRKRFSRPDSVRRRSRAVLNHGR